MEMSTKRASKRKNPHNNLSLFTPTITRYNILEKKMRTQV